MGSFNLWRKLDRTDLLDRVFAGFLGTAELRAFANVEREDDAFPVVFFRLFFEAIEPCAEWGFNSTLERIRRGLKFQPINKFRGS
jgi:hypothetical protein